MAIANNKNNLTIDDYKKLLDDAIEQENNAQLVRYEGGETATDRKGNVFTRPASPVEKLQGKGDTVPLTAKKGEPENRFEWAQDIANETIKTGKDPKEVYESLRKKYPFSAARIDDEINDTNAESGPTKERYRYLDPQEFEDGDTVYYDPGEAGNKKVAQTYKLPGDEYRDGSLFPSSSYLNLLKDNKLLDRWNSFMNGRFSDKSATLKGDIYKDYTALADEIHKLRSITDLKVAKKYGFESIDDYKIALNQLYTKLGREANNYIKAIDERNSATNKEETIKDVAKVNQEEAEQMRKEAAATQPVVEEPKQQPAPQPTAVEQPETKQPTAEQPTSNAVLASLEQENSEAEEEIQQQAEAISETEKTEKELDDIDKEIEQAARKLAQDKFDYEEWLKNPTIISGVFGRSGLSTARRVGLGLAALFAIASDAAHNWARGLNGNTDFKFTAINELNSTIKSIQDARATQIGKMASKPYETTSENEEKLNKDYEKLRRLPTGAYIQEDTLKAFIQASQLDPEKPLSDDVINAFNDESRQGFIESISRSKLSKYRDDLIDKSTGELTPLGEARFWKTQENAIKQYARALNMSDERLANIDKILTMAREQADTRKKLHDVIFQTKGDYINALGALNNENTALQEAMLNFSKATTEQDLLNVARDFRSVIAGLSSSSLSATNAETDAQATLNRFTEQNGLEKVNEELKKHGWQAEINASATGKVPIGIVSVGANIAGGGRWTSEEAQKYVESAYEKFTKDEQLSKNTSRSVSNATGQSIDSAYNAIIDYLSSSQYKDLRKDLDALKNAIQESIRNKIDFNNNAIKQLEDMQKREEANGTILSPDAGATLPPNLMSMFSDVPSKSPVWYSRRLSLT